ncbi:MAG: alpha/beta fold hydrolase [Chloroflexi bacterium]|nr:alpha/beta fold hydrolase [Chloroflexota bacterium]
MLHGGSARWQEFEPLIPALAERWHALGPDFRGHGKFGWTPKRYRLRDYAADTVGFLERRVGESQPSTSATPWALRWR